MVHEESGIKFDFPESSKTVEFDKEKFYRNEFNSLPGSKGVDFISMDKEYVAFIEVKNCQGDFGGHTRSKKAIMSKLQESMNTKMRWLHCRVSVVDSSTYDPGIFKIIK